MGVSMCTSHLRVVISRANCTYEGKDLSLIYMCILKNGFCVEVIIVEGSVESLNWEVGC